MAVPDWAREPDVPEWAREKPAPTRNIAAVANDWVIEAANAIAGTAGAVSEFVSPGNRFAKGVEDFVRKGEESQSDVTKQSKQRMRQGLEQAEGFGQEAGVIGQYLLESPGLATAQALGSFAGPGVAITGASRLAGGVAAGRAAAGGATAAEAAARGAQVGSRVGLGAGAVVSGAAAGGDAAGNAYDLVMAAPDEVLSVTPEWQELAATLPPEQIKERLATAAARDGSVLPAIVGAVTGAFGAEKLIAGTPVAKIIGQATSRRAAALRTGLTEATQEGFEEGITQYEGQRAASQYDPLIDPMKGVGGAATMGAALGGVSGGVIGGVVGPERITALEQKPQVDQDAQLDQTLNRLETARNEVFLGTSDGKETLANIVSAPDLGAAIDAAEASVPSMADLLQQKRTTAAERVAQELGIEPAGNFPTAEQIIGGAPIPGIDVGPAGENTRPSVFGQSAGTPGLQPGQTRILTQPSVFAEPSAGTPGLQPGETRILTQPSVFADSDSTPGLRPGQRLDTPAPPATPDLTRLNTAQAGVDRDAQLLAQRDGTPAPQPPEQMLRNAQRLEESARLIESNPRAPEAVLQRAQVLREQAQSLRARAEEAAASAPAEQAGAMTQFEREQIDAQRQVNQDKRLPSRQDTPAAGYADLAPMDERTARGRLKVLRDQTANEGGDALGLQVVPHPNTEGKFAIAKAELPSLDMPAAAAPAPVTQQEAGQRLEAAAAKAPTDADAMIAALKVRDTGQVVGAQLLDMLSPGDQAAYSGVLRSVEQRGGQALPLEAALLDRVNPGAKNYDSLVSAPVGRDQLRTLQGLTESITALGDPQKQAKDAAGEQLRLNALVRQGERALGIEQPRAERAPESLVVENKSPTAGGVERAGQMDRRTGTQRSDDAFAALERNKALQQISANLANLFPQQRATEAPDVALIDRVLRKTGALRTADEKMVVDGARKVLTPAQFDILQRGALNPASLGAVERLQLRRMREGDFKFSEQRQAETGVTSQGQPVKFDPSTQTIVDPVTLPAQSRSQPGVLSKQQHRLVSLMGSLFGKKVVVFDHADPTAPDGYVREGDTKTIYLNRKSEISHLVVFGHELLHQLKRDNPAAYDAIIKVIKLEGDADLNVPGIRGDMEELTADVVGNRFRDEQFWRDVFNQILTDNAGQKGKNAVMRLGASVVRAVNKMVKALKGATAYNTDDLVANLEEVKAAVTKALATYAQAQRGEATALIREQVAGQQAPAADATGEVVTSDKRGQLDNVEAYRYGKTARTFVNGSSFGAGLKGSSRETYMNAEDKRLKQRVYFYFDKGTGINPEAGVGPIPHRAFLNNVYDADADPQKLVAGNQLKTESNILDAGFDGYLNRLGGTQSGQVIMFGLKPIPVEALQPGQKVRSGAKLEPLKTSAPAWTTQSSSGNKSMLEQKLARMQDSPSWASYDMRIVGTTPGMYELQTKLKGGVVASEKRVVNTPEFKRWFGDSKVVDGRGRPLVVYTGTSKDVDFTKFKVPKNGVWFTTDPAGASMYAMENDSKDLKYNPDTRRYDEVNTASRVMPVFLRIENPATLSEADSQAMRFASNYRKVQGQIFDRLRAQGYDGVDMGDGVWVAIGDPAQIKSATGNSGAFDPNNPDIRKSEKRILLNIGLSTEEVKGGGMLTEDVVRSALAKLGLKVDSLTVQQSNSELTAIPAVDRPLSQEEGDDLSVRLNQQAIVQRMPDGSGVLFGPMADEWGPYNPAYFLMQDGSFAVDQPVGVVASAKRKRLDPEVVQTLGRHIRNLLPDEKTKLRRDTAQKMVDIIEGLPQASEMAAVAYAGRAKRGWYYNSAQAIEQVFGGDGPRFAALLAALSPQTSVEANLYNTLATWKNWVQAGRPTDRGEIVAIMGRSAQGSGTEASVLDAWKNNAVRALTANDPSSVTISGPKVNSFMLNLRGYVDEVTNDAWMANYALVDQKIFSGKLNAAGTDPGKTPGYLAMSARVREAAKVLSRLTGETWTPAEVQETVWSWAKTLYESASVNKSAADIVRNKEITDELIRATPDFRTLFNTDVNERLLRDAGLGDQVERLRAGGDLGGAGQQAAATGGQAAPFAADAQQRYELRAARRLDRLREQRAEGDEIVASEKREVASLFKGLQESRGLGRVRALERVDAHPLGATIRQIDADFLDILDRLDTAGLVKINCK